jgi:hypothetical protein
LLHYRNTKQEWQSLNRTLTGRLHNLTSASNTHFPPAYKNPMYLIQSQDCETVSTLVLYRLKRLPAYVLQPRPILAISLDKGLADATTRSIVCTHRSGADDPSGILAVVAVTTTVMEQHISDPKDSPG